MYLYFFSLLACIIKFTVGLSTVIPDEVLSLVERSGEELNVAYFVYYLGPSTDNYPYYFNPSQHVRCDMYAQNKQVKYYHSSDIFHLTAYYAPLKPADFSPYDTNDIVGSATLEYTCCMTGGACPAYVDRYNPYRVNFIIRSVGRNTGLFKSETDHLPCYTCIMRDTGPRQCPDGTYADKYLTVNEYGIVSDPVHCIPCAPGTWMACTTKSSCTWTIPFKASPQLAYSTDYYIFTDPPVGACYPCEKAGRRVFYADDPKASRINADAPWSGGVLPWYCPGNQAGHDGVPRMCPQTYVGSYPPYSKCSCGEGQYDDPVSGCISCPPGTYCVNGTRFDCDDDSYQTLPGQTSCIRCSYNTILCSPGSYMRRCIGSYKTMFPACVGCNACIRPNLPNAAGKVECLISSS